MRPLQIDFLPPAQVPVWAVVVCTTLIAAVLASGTWAWSVHAENIDLILRLANARKVRQEVTVAVQDIPAFAQAPPAYEMDAKRALEEAHFVTSQALATLEKVHVPGVLPISVELRAESRMAQVEIEYSDLSDLMKFVRELNTNDSRQNWQILRVTSKELGQSSGFALLEVR